MLAALLLAACSRTKVYDSYCHTPLSGWEKNSPAEFSVPPVAESGSYGAEVGLRVSEAFPFTDLTLVVVIETLPQPPATATTTSVSLPCPLFSNEGRPLGAGLSYWQLAFPLNPLYLQAGDSLHVTIRHDMKREILPGISDVGFSLIRQ